MTSRYDALSDRARWFLNNFDEIDLADICAAHEASNQTREAAIDRVRALRDPIAEALENADYRPDMRRGDLADAVMPVILAALDGTEQPTKEQP